MRCNRCTDQPTTVGEVLGCKFCRDDGTANEIPKDMLGHEPLRHAVTRRPGMSNRFTEDPAEAKQGAAESALAAATAKPKGRARKIVDKLLGKQ